MMEEQSAVKERGEIKEYSEECNRASNRKRIKIRTLIEENKSSSGRSWLHAVLTWAVHQATAPPAPR